MWRVGGDDVLLGDEHHRETAFLSIALHHLFWALGLRVEEFGEESVLLRPRDQLHSTLYPAPCTLHPTPYLPHTTPPTPHSTPHTLHFETLHPTPYTLTP